MKPGGSSHHAGALIGSVNWQRGGPELIYLLGFAPQGAVEASGAGRGLRASGLAEADVPRR